MQLSYMRTQGRLLGLSLYRSWEDWNELSWRYEVAIWGNYDVTVRSRRRGYVARSLPADQFYF
jgi:hypothetical protein